MQQPLHQQSEFAKKASAIGLSISKTSAKLQKLAQLAKRTSMFDDPSSEIDELTGILKQDIQGLNAAIAELQRVSAARRGGHGARASAKNAPTEQHGCCRSAMLPSLGRYRDQLSVNYIMKRSGLPVASLAY